jgi:hypothetical protein
VVSWKEAAEMKLSVESDALVIPSNRLMKLASRLDRSRIRILVTTVAVEHLRALCLLTRDELGIAKTSDLNTTQHLANNYGLY